MFDKISLIGGIFIKTVGMRLKEIRLLNDLTQSKIASCFGVSISTISFIENGKRDPDIMLLIAYRNFFNISIDELLDNVAFTSFILKDQNNKYTYDKLDNIDDEILRKLKANKFLYDQILKYPDNAFILLEEIFKSVVKFQREK